MPSVVFNTVPLDFFIDFYSLLLSAEKYFSLLYRFVTEKILVLSPNFISFDLYSFKTCLSIKKKKSIKMNVTTLSFIHSLIYSVIQTLNINVG